jgi:hypothetical protein
VFGFKAEFRTWVNVLMTDSESAVNHGGWLSESFGVACGIRQGCPFSPLAFVLAVELLAVKIRNSSNIIGIRNPTVVDGQYVYTKIKQMADDMTLFLKDRTEVENSINIIDLFGRFSGLRLNMQKTMALRMGNQAVERNIPVPVVDKIKILGIYFERGKAASDIEENWKGRVERIQALIKNWSCRDLSIHGKVVVIKTFLLSQLTYVMQSIGLPLVILKKVNTMFYKFLWQRKCSNRKAFEKVKRKVMESDYDCGGVKMVNVLEVQKCFYLQWIGKLYNAKDANWSLIPKWHYGNLARGKDIFDLNCSSKQVKGLERITNVFWKEALCSYLNVKLQTDTNDVNINNFPCQQLFNNKLILYKGKVLFFSKWLVNGISHVKDLISEQENRLHSLAEVQAMIDQNPAVTMFEYFAVINAIPIEWVNWVQSGNVNVDQEHDSDSEASVYDKKPKFIKMYLQSRISERVRSHGRDFWLRKFNVDLDENAWQIPHLVTKEVRLRELQWKINHNIYPTNILLQKMKATE